MIGRQNFFDDKASVTERRTAMAHTLIGIIPALICAAYGICILCVGSGSGFFLVWFLLAAVILLQTFLTALPEAYAVWIHAARILLRLFWILFAVVVGITWLLIGTHFSAKGDANLDYMIVLGSQVRADGPAVITKYRLDRAREYLKDHPETVCIVSGGQGKNEPAPEAVIMKQYLVQKGIPTEQILTEDRSLNTIENIRNSKAMILEQKSAEGDAEIEDDVGIVTNNFHVFRGVMLARHAGFRKVSGIAAYTNPFYLPNNMLRETCGILKDFLCGNLL